MTDLNKMRETRARILREHTPESFDQWLREKRLKRIIESFGSVEAQTLTEMSPRVFFDTEELKDQFKVDPALSDVYEAAPNDNFKYVLAA